MKVWVMNLESPDDDCRADVYSLSYESSNMEFSMPCPMGDDWLQQVRHKPTPSPELVKVNGSLMVVVFNKHECAQRFSTWLLDAESRAQHGYRTMRG
jgi:hypothetical protein